MTKSTQKLQIIIFLSFIALFFVLNLALPDKEFSEQENRYLQTVPSFSLQALFAGRYTTDFEAYTTDQFASRDTWTSLKARSELFVGKQENNDVYYCRSDALPGGTALIERFIAPSDEALDTGLAALSKLRENVDCPVYLALIPGSAEIWNDSLPSNAPHDSERAVIDYVYARADAETVDMYGTLAPHAGEYIFYRTDHHWTSLGAYYGYTALMEAMGLTASPLSAYEPVTVSDDFYGTIHSKSGFSWHSPDTMQTFVEPPPGLSVTSYPEGAPEVSALYDEAALATKDKYGFFLGGNSPLVQIETGQMDAPALLILRDSYADSLVPFLLGDFSEIHLFDLRYNRTSLAAYVQEHDFDSILVCYSVPNFCTDANLFLMGR